MLQLLEFRRRALQLLIRPVPRLSGEGAEGEAAGSFLFHRLDAELLHAPSLCELQVEVAALDGPVHLKAEAQARILYQVNVDLLRDGLELVSIQIGQGNLLHLSV